ncbi:hypothetical protein [Gemella cuniculi]|uniref:hypothetical protein n=1 Tax=Gemella cuniculi TaxID=150240 RepID=UPI0004077BCE|nr:hypothetical protein [Gemella cuniculi]
MKEEIRRSIVVRTILLLAGIIFSVCLWCNVNQTAINYEKVEVIVSNVESELTRAGIQYKITVLDKGVSKELENVKRGFSYSMGDKIEVFSSQGHLYEDESGVRSNTNAAIYYFASLFVDLLLLILLVYKIIIYRRTVE